MVSSTSHGFLSGKHFWKIFRNSFPLAISLILTFLMDSISLAFAGRLQDIHIVSGMGLTIMTVTLLWTTTSTGMNGALETLASQAYGSKAYDVCGKTLNRGIIVLSMIYLLIIVCLINIDIILGIFGVEEHMIMHATDYAYRMILYYYLQGLFDLHRKYLVVIGKSQIPMIVQALTIPYHISMCYFLTAVWKYGLYGIVISANITIFAQFSLIRLYMSVNKDSRQTLQRMNIHSFKGLYTYVKLGFSTTLMVWLDAWCFNLMTLVATYLSVVETNSQVVVASLINTIYSIPMGFSSGACSLVGRNIGKGRIMKARMYSYQSLFILTLTVIPICLIFYFIPEKILGIYTNDQKVIEIASFAVVISSIGFLIDCCQTLLQGVIKGLELQSQACYANSLNYIVGIPFGVLLSFKTNMRIAGLWTGLYICQALISLYFLVLIKCSSWESAVRRAKKRIKRDKYGLEGKDFKDKQKQEEEQQLYLNLNEPLIYRDEVIF